MDKHGEGKREDNTIRGFFPRPKGNQAEKNRKAQEVATEIITHPDVTYEGVYKQKFGYVVEAILPDGRGIVVDLNGKFLYFMEKCPSCQ